MKHEQEKSLKWSQAIVGMFVLLIGVAIGNLVIPSYRNEAINGDNKTLSERRQWDNGTGSLTNPLLECRELPEPLSIGGRVALESEIQKLLDESKKRGDISDASVYFRELIGGPWFGIDEEKKFTPASLLKLPLAISYFWLAEENPEILKDSIVYEKGSDNYEANQPYAPSVALQNGRTYSVTELIALMLEQSSNEAALVLSQMISEADIKNVYKDFGFATPGFGQDYKIDVHTYGSFFRILFNATYLDRPASENLLRILTKTNFKDGLVAGVPSDIVVAHKFGTREVGEERQLHDCGIVYAPNKPYILCVMTKGKDFSELARLIQKVSNMVYQEIVR